MSDQLTIRLASPSDGDAVARLAKLDSSRTPSGPLLLAEVDGTIRAAFSLAGDGAVADPFYPSGALVEMLSMRAKVSQPRSSRSRRLLPTLRLA